MQRQKAFFFFLLLSWMKFVEAADTAREQAFVRSIENQRIVILHTPKKKSALRKQLTKVYVKTVAEGNSFLVVRPQLGKKIQYFQTLKKLEKLPFVKKVVPDRLVFALESSSRHTKPALTEELSRPRAQDLVFPGEVSSFSRTTEDCNEKENSPMECKNKMESEEERKNTCHIAKHCGKENPSWVRQVTGADLTDGVIEKLWSEKGKDINLLPRVGIVDSGFDKEGNEKNLETPDVVRYGNIKSEDGVIAGSSKKDESGHGTAVAGAIAGKDVGITKYARLSFYRVTEPGVRNTTSGGLLDAAIEKACEENDIVNVSWGSLAAEKGNIPYVSETLQKRIDELGCLVVQAAGNSGESVNPEHDGSKSHFLVEANDSFGSPGFFSSSGDINAMGQGIYSLMASSVTPQSRNGACCVTSEGRLFPVKGTSFASPIMTGIAAQIFAVAKLRGHLPSDKLKRMDFLTNRLRLANMATNGIVKDSRDAGGRRIRVKSFPSSYSAILLRPPPPANAPPVNDDFISKNHVPSTLDHYISHFDSWINQFHIASDCPVKSTKCSHPVTCNEKQECFLELRRLYFICFGNLNFPGSEKSLELLKVGERATFTAMSLYQENEEIQSTIQEELEREWKELLKGNRSIPPENFFKALELMNSQSYLASTAETRARVSPGREGPRSMGEHANPYASPFITEVRVLQLLGSDKLAEIFSQNEDTPFLATRRSSNSWEEMNSFAQSRRIVSQIQRWIDSFPLPQRLKLRDSLITGAKQSRKKLGKGVAYLLPHLIWNSEDQEDVTSQFMRAISQGEVPTLTPSDILGKYFASAGRSFSYFVPENFQTESNEIWKEADKELFEPISSKNIHALASALISRSPNIWSFLSPRYSLPNSGWWALGPEETAVLKHLFKSEVPSKPDFDMKEYASILEYAASRTIDTFPQDYLDNELSSFFLTNPFAALPANAVSERSNYYSPKFFLSFAKANLQRLLPKLVGGTGKLRENTDPPAGHEMRNVMRAISEAAQIDLEDFRSISNSGFDKAIEEAIKNIKKDEDLNQSVPGTNVSLETIKEVLKGLNSTHIEVQNSLRSLLSPLKTDVLERPKAYPCDFRTLVNEALNVAHF